MRDSVYYLLNCPELDIAHNNTPYFSTHESQLRWFIQRKLLTIENVQFHRKDNSIKVGKHIHDLEFVNYVMVKNEGDSRYYFYFVYDRLYVNENNTFLYLKLDVIQTYLFDIDYGCMSSFIDRSHVDRFGEDNLPLLNNIMIPENIEVGEYVEFSRNTIYDYATKGGYIVASEDKLTAKNGGSSGGGGGGVSEKMVSADGFVLIKCMEAFSPTPYNIGDGTNTIGYGVTEKYQPDYYNQLAPECTEEQASEILLDVITNNFSIAVYNKMQEYGKDMSSVKQNEFDAFVSLAYNAGIGGMTRTQIFIDYCNNVSRETIYNKWLTTIIMEGSQFEQGLRDRRQREATVFRDNIYNFKTIGIVGGGTVTDNGGKGHIPSKLLGISSTELQDKILNSARELIGKPYVWGGNYPPLGNDEGTDCSGLVQWAYYKNGRNITRTTYTQIKEGIEVLPENVQKGDLVFSNFSSYNTPEHVFLYSGYDSEFGHMCIEAPQTGYTIRERIFKFTDEMRVRRLI